MPEFKNLRSKLNLRSVIEILTITERTVYKHSTPQYSVWEPWTQVSVQLMQGSLKARFYKLALRLKPHLIKAYSFEVVASKLLRGLSLKYPKKICPLWAFSVCFIRDLSINIQSVLVGSIIHAFMDFWYKFLEFCIRPFLVKPFIKLGLNWLPINQKRKREIEKNKGIGD